MSLNLKIKELRSKSQEELNETLEKLLRDRFKLRLKKSNGDSINYSEFKQIKRSIARILTIQS